MRKYFVSVARSAVFENMNGLDIFCYLPIRVRVDELLKLCISITAVKLNSDGRCGV